MAGESVFLPVAVLALWTIAVLTLVPLTRIRAIKDRRLQIKDFRYGESERVAGEVSLPNRDYMNLLELPVLFYVLALILFVTQRVDTLNLVLAWTFVGSRLAHSVIHLAYNNVLHRFRVFAFGYGVLAVMWVRLAISLVWA